MTPKTNRKRNTAIELLEGRLLLAAHTWTGGGGDGNWSNAANWTGVAPAAAESNVTLDFPAGPSTTTLTNDISGLTIQGITVEANYQISGQSLTIAGSITTAGGTYVSMTDNVTLGADLSLTIGQTLNLTGTIDGGYGINQSGGYLWLSGSNAYTGSTTVSNGLLSVGFRTALGTGTITVNAGASVEIQPGQTISNDLVLSGTGSAGAVGALFVAPAYGSGIGTWTGTITLSGGATVAGTPGSPASELDLTGNIAGTGDLTIGNGIVVPTGANSYTGNTVVSAGLLKLSASSATAGDLTIDAGEVDIASAINSLSTSTVDIESGATLNIANGVSQYVLALTGTGTLTGAGTLIEQSPGSPNFSGTISASAGITFDGIGGPTLAATGTTSGTLTLSMGEMFMHGNLPDALFVQDGGGLFGSGTVGTLHSDGGYMEIGDATPGTITTGSIWLDSGSEWDWWETPAASYSSFNATGSVTLAGVFNLVFISTPAAGSTFTLINNEGSQPVAGTFQNMPEGDVVQHNNGDWKISYVGGDGNDVTLTYLGLPTTTTLNVAAASAAYGQGVLSATVATVSGSGTPTGTVTFASDGTTIGTATLNGQGVATLDAPMPVGTYGNITASYAGDSTYEVSGPSTAGSLTVTRAATTISATPSASSLGAGATISITAAVSDLPAPSDPTGTVDFFNNSTLIGTATIDNSGHATLDNVRLGAGSNELTAAYAGDANFLASTAAQTLVSVLPSVSLGDVSVTKSPTGTTAAEFPLTLSEASNLPVTVNYLTHDGSAQAGRDYTTGSGSVTFAPGQTTASASVSVSGGADWQPDRQFTLAIVGITNGTAATGQALATLHSTDAVPTSGLVPDELDPTQTDLVVDLPARSAAQVRTTRTPGQIQVVIRGKVVSSGTNLDRVIVYGGGNNTLTIAARVTAGVIFFGGAGRNTVTGGRGNDILVGGSGTNTLNGGTGMNLLIGGAGRATLGGSTAGNVLVGGNVSYADGSLSGILKLESVLAAWTDGSSYANRVAELANGTGETDAILADSDVTFVTADHLTGRANRDLRLQQVVVKSAKR